MSKGFEKKLERRKRETLIRSAVDAEEIQGAWMMQFKSLKDPRGKQGIEHEFLSIVIIAVLSTLAGGVGWEDMELYGESHQKWLGTFLNLRNGIPSPDTYRRLFERIEPEELQECFLGWVKQVVEATGAQVIPIDGKTIRGSYDRGSQKPALHMVSAWASDNRLMLGQVKVEAKTNEITAIPALLKLLDITGCIITIDAMGTQTAIARQIVEKGADYILCLKSNHPKLWQDVKQWFGNAQGQSFEGIEHQRDVRVESGHHRRELRKVWAVPIHQMGPLHQIARWAGLKTIVMVSRIRRLWNKTTREVMYYLSSMDCDAVAIGRAIRTHWSIENQLHWVLDVTFREDASRIRTGHAPENVSLLRRLALGILNQEKSTKRSIRQKMHKAAMSSNYMLDLLHSAISA
jgi:predicted transposase YbfD/YdcC